MSDITKKLKKLEKNYRQLEKSFREKSYKEPPGPYFNGLCVSAAQYQGMADGLKAARVMIEKAEKSQ